MKLGKYVSKYRFRILVALVLMVLVAPYVYAMIRGFSESLGMTSLYSGSAVQVLTPKDFKNGKATCGKGAVVFYAPWCGHCKTMSADWKKFAHQAPQGFKVAALDCEAYPAVAQEFGVNAYPTIFMIDSQGNLVRYKGERDLRSLVTWANSA